MKKENMEKKSKERNNDDFFSADTQAERQSGTYYTIH